ncbi:MAG: UDP-N-acetylmuramoyl-tripeptide--D-alanyl-D-alanine ligase, partial [Deltaproteobacteria bacterium]|nr:UDP-N-acetylmuramoyl-tripeptide--D-alanyl-D-alanine ligase [Deltaproteobacteria bacterium]
KGEIKTLTEIARPTIGLITNVNPAHLEKLHTVENVALAKGELFEAMDPDGTIVVNAEDPWVVSLSKKYKGNKIYFGMQNNCDVRFGRMISEGLDKVGLTFYVGEKEYSMTLPVPGVHNVMNALAAVSAGIAAGASADSMISGLENFSKMKMRMERVQLANGVQLINDSYNANPSSMHAAFRTVSGAKRAGRFIAVLGDMLELGETSSEKHSELGKNAASFGVAKLFVTGSYAKDVADGARKNGLDSANVAVAADAEELKKLVISEIKTGDIVLVKGSRGMRMEQVVEYLKDNVGV